MRPADLGALREVMELGRKTRSPDLPAVALSRFLHEDATGADQVAGLEFALAVGGLVLFGKLHASSLA